MKNRHRWTALSLLFIQLTPSVATADCTGFTETSSPGDPATVARVTLDSECSLGSDLTVIVKSTDGAVVGEARVSASDLDPADLSVDIGRWRDPQSRSGVYRIWWSAISDAGSPLELEQHFTVPCPAPPIPPHQFLPGSNRLVFDVSPGDRCEGETVAILDVRDIDGNGVMDPLSQSFSAAAGQRLSFELDQLDGERSYTGLLSLRNESGQTSQSEFSFLTGCGSISATGRLVEDRLEGTLAASSCHFPVAVKVDVLAADGSLISGGEAVLREPGFGFILPDHSVWAAGDYMVTAKFESAEGRRAELSLSTQIHCAPPTLSDVSIDTHTDANQPYLTASYASLDVCQSDSELTVQLRDADNVVVFNRTLASSPSASPEEISFPLDAVPGATYDLHYTARYGASQGEEFSGQQRLVYECTDPAILDFGYADPDASTLGGIVRLASCNLPVTAKITVQGPEGRVVATREMDLTQSPHGPFSVVPETSIRHLPTGAYTASLKLIDNQGRILSQDLELNRDVDGPAIVFHHRSSPIDATSVPTVTDLSDLSVSYSDASALLSPASSYLGDSEFLDNSDARAVIREVAGESGSELWFTGYVDLARTAMDWGFVGLLLEDGSDNRFLAPVTRRYVPLESENIRDFHPSRSRAGFRSVVRTSSLVPGAYRVLGVLISESGQEVLVPGQAALTISSLTSRRPSAFLRRGVVEYPLILDFLRDEVATVSPVTAIPDGTYSLQVTGQDRYGNASEPARVSFTYLQDKERLTIRQPAVAGQRFSFAHSFVSTRSGSSHTRPLRIVVRRIEGVGAIELNERTVDSQTIEYVATPDSSGRVQFDVALATTDVDARFIVHPDSVELRPLELTVSTYTPEFDLLLEEIADGGRTLRVTNRAPGCERFAVFSSLSDLKLSRGQVLCAFRISHPSVVVDSSSAAAATLSLPALDSEDISYETGFVLETDGRLSFHRVESHLISELHAVTLSPRLEFEPSPSLRERGTGLITRTGVFQPGSVVIRSEKPGAIIELNGHRPLAPLSTTGIHRVPIETSVQDVGDTQRIQVRAFYKSTPEHMTERDLTFVAVPPPISILAVKADLVYPRPLSIDFRVDSVETRYDPGVHGGYAVREAYVVSRTQPNAPPAPVSASLTDQGLVHASLPELEPGEYRLNLSVVSTDPRISEHLLPVVEDSAFQVVDGTPLDAEVFTFRSSDSAPFFGHLALSVLDRNRLADLSTTIWESSSDGKNYFRFQQGPSAVDFVLAEASSRYFRARLINRHSQSESVTVPIRVSAFPPAQLSVQGPNKTFRGWAVVLRAIGVAPETVLWRMTPPNGDRPVESKGPTLTINPDVTGRYFIEAISKHATGGPDALSSQRVFKTVDVRWARIPPAVISGPTQVEMGRATTFTVRHPPIFDGGGNANIRRVGEWQLPNGDVIPNQEWVEYTLEQMPEGEPFINILYHAWIDGDRESTLTTAIHRVRPYTYRWPEWELHAETISSELPSIVRLSVRPSKWNQWLDIADTPIQTAWQLPSQAHLRYKTNREVILDFQHDRPFDAAATVTDTRGNVSDLRLADVYPVRDAPFDVATRLVPERSLHTAPIRVDVAIEAILLPKDRSITRVAYYLDGYYSGATNGGPIQLEVRTPGQHLIRAIVSIDNDFVAEDTVVFEVGENLPAICSIQSVGNFTLNGVAKAECEDPDGQMVEYRWYLNGRLVNSTGSRVQLNRQQIQEATELSLIAVDSAGKEATARFLPKGGA